MNEYNALKDAIKAAIKPNGVYALTAQIFQNILIAIVDSFGKGYQFMGIATADTEPGEPDEKEFYVGFAGEYANFGEETVTVPLGGVVIFIYDTEWRANVVKVAERVAVSDNHLEIDGVRSIIEQDVVNVNTLTSQDEAFLTAAAARAAVSAESGLRIGGQVITYLVETDEEHHTAWVVDQYTGDDAEGWENDDNWQPFLYFELTKIVSNQAQVNEAIMEALGDRYTKEESNTITDGLKERVETLEEHEQIMLDGGNIGIASAADIANPTTANKAKVPTVGALLESGLTVLDISALYPTGGESSTDHYTLAGAIAMVDSDYQKGGISIKFKDAGKDNYPYVQYTLMSASWSNNVNLWRGADGVGYLNVNEINQQSDAYSNAAAARAAVPAVLRRPGLQIAYLVTSGAESIWVQDLYIGAAADSTSWATAANWKTNGPVSVSDVSLNKCDIKIIEGDITFDNSKKINVTNTFQQSYLKPDGTMDYSESFNVQKFPALPNHIYLVKGYSPRLGCLAAAYTSDNSLISVYEIGTQENYADFKILTPANTAYIQVCGTNRDGITVKDYALLSRVMIPTTEKLEHYISGEYFVSPNQTIGTPIALGGSGTHRVYNIPENSDVTISVKSGDTYGFALTDSDDNVIEYHTNDADVDTNISFANTGNVKTKLYVSDYKFKQGFYQYPKLLNDILKIKETVPLPTSSNIDYYIHPNQVIGNDIRFGTSGHHKVFNIPANAIVHINCTTGGSYGYAMTDINNKVLEYSDVRYNLSYTFKQYPFETKLYVSSEKFTDGTLTTVIAINDEVNDLQAQVINLQNENAWNKKTIWWCGTSIPAGSASVGNYPTEVGKNLKADVINKSVGSSMCRANVRTGDYVGANFSNITSALSMTKAEIENFISNYSTIKDVLTGSVPDTLSADNISRLRAASFEDRLLPYLNGTYPMPDLFVFDHGHNDFKYKLSNNESDITLQPTLANIGNELTEDTYMTANNNEKLESFFGSLTNIPIARKNEFIASLNRNCYIGAVNFLVTLILKYNPHARIIFISNYQYENGVNATFAPLIQAQEDIAKSWALPLCRMYEYLGYSNHIIPDSMAWFNEQYPNVTPTTTDITVYRAYLPDNVHPHSETTGDSIRIYAGILTEFIKKCR